MYGIHSRLRKSFSWYDTWHKHPHHQHAHWFGLFAFLLVMTLLVSVQTALYLVEKPEAQAATTVLGISGNRFTINGQAKFLVLAAYFDGTDSSDPIADINFLKSKNFDGVRIFPNWWENVGSLTTDADPLITSDGSLDQSKLTKLISIIDEADRLGMIVDVTFAREVVSGNCVENNSYNPNILCVQDFKRGVVAVAQALRNKTNVFYDLSNEHDATGFSPTDVADLKGMVENAIGTSSILSVSLGNSVNGNALNVANNYSMDIVSAHFACGQPNSGCEFDADISTTLTSGKPTYIGEPNNTSTVSPNATTGWSGYSAQDFIDAVVRAKTVGIAAWTFHTDGGWYLNGTSLQSQFQSSQETGFINRYLQALQGVIWGGGGSGALIINSLQPTSGPVGTSVTVTGNGFTPTGNKIKFGDSGSENDPSYSLNSSDGRTLVFPVPNSKFLSSYPQPGFHSVSVINSSGTSNTVPFMITTAYPADPLAPITAWIDNYPTSCISGTYNATVNWGMAPDPSAGYYIDISTDPNFNGRWTKHIANPTSLRSTVAIDGTFYNNPDSPSSEPGSLSAGKNYYIRVWSGSFYNATPFPFFVCSNPPSGLIPPTLQQVNPGIACANGPYSVDINWTGSPSPDPTSYDFYVDISTDNFTSFWNKGVNSATSTQAPSGFSGYRGVSGNLVLNPGTTYQAQVFNGATDSSGQQLHSNMVSFRVPACSSSLPQFDTVNNEFVLTDKTAMDSYQGKGIWLSNKRIKVYRNVHGSNWSPIKPFSFLTANSAYTLNPLEKLMPVSAGGGVVYVNDGSAYWSNNPYQPGINEDQFESRVGLGYTKEGVVYRNLDLKVTYFVSSYDISDPVIIQLVEAKNLGSTQKTYQFFSYQDIVPDGTASFDSNTKTVYIDGGDANTIAIDGGLKLFLTSTEPIVKYDTAKSSFFGTGGESDPQTVISGNLNNSLASSDDILAGQVAVTIDPGATKTFAFILGSYKDNLERDRLLAKYGDISAVKSAQGLANSFYAGKTDRIPGINSRTSTLQTQLRILGYSALSTSMFWDPFVNNLTLNQMAIYNETVNARDTAQIALGLIYLDPELAQQGLKSYFGSAQYSNGRMPYGLNIFGGDGNRSKPDNSSPPAGKWGSDNIGWMTLAACSHSDVNGAGWLSDSLSYKDGTQSTVYGHIIKALEYDYTNNIHANGLVATQGGDWIDHFHGYDADDGESVYSSALLYAATKKCLPFMTSSDSSIYSQRATSLKNSIENSAYDSSTGRYRRLLLESGGNVGGSSDGGRIFSDLAVLGLTGDFDFQRVKNTVLAAYSNNKGSGNLVYTPSYSVENSSLGAYSKPNWLFDNKVWARVCSLVTVALKNQGLMAEADRNFIDCLPNKWTKDGYASLFNYIELYDPRGDTAINSGGYVRLSDWSFSDAVDDSMAIWAQAQSGRTTLTLNYFDAQPRETTTNNITLSWSATGFGNLYLSRAELYRTPTNSNCTVTNGSGCNWVLIQNISAPSNSNSWSSSITDSPGAGSYLYGIHVVDNSGNRVIQPAAISVSINDGTSDTSFPILNSFNAQSISNTTNVNITWSVNDSGGSYLSKVYLYRANAGSSCTVTDKTGCNWAALNPNGVINAPSNSNSWSSSITDSPGAGSYLYGIHVQDGAGNRISETPLVLVVVNGGGSGSAFPVTIAANSGIITAPSHGFMAGDAVVFSTTGTLPPALNAGTTYYVISNNLSSNQFMVSDTVNGSAINTSGTQSGTHMVAEVTLAAAGSTGAIDAINRSLTGFQGTDLSVTGLFSLLTSLTCYFIQFAIIMISVMIIVYGIMFLQSRGNPQGMMSSRKALAWGIVGGIVIFGVFTIILSVANLIGIDYPILNIINCSQSSSGASSIESVNYPKAAFGLAEGGVVPQDFSLLVNNTVQNITGPIEGVKLSVDEILVAPTDSGWVYIANTVPDSNGIMFWGSITKIMGNAGLLYGITDTLNNTYYSGFLTGGVIDVSDMTAYKVSYLSGTDIIFEARQTSQFSTDLTLSVNLPWPTNSNPQRIYRLNQNFSMTGPPIYESGDGVVQMGSGQDSWYISFVFNPGLWMDVQKFNFVSTLGRGNLDHRWGSFIINKDNTSLPIGTRGVWWDILDGGNRLINFDLVRGSSFTSFTQQTVNNFQFLPITYWDSGKKRYSTKYKIIQANLGIDLTMEAVIDNQENFIGLTGQYFYEGMTKIFDNTTGLQIGAGMHEQTRDDSP